MARWRSGGHTEKDRSAESALDEGFECLSVWVCVCVAAAAPADAPVAGDKVESDARLDAASAPAALAGVAAGDEAVLERLHAARGVVAGLLHAPGQEACIDGDVSETRAAWIC